MKNEPTSYYEPLVSVALATYNGDKYLPQQLTSLLSQSYINLEIIISDDNSDDYTLEIIKKFLIKDSRIKLFKNKGKRGVVSNFTNAIKNCTGEIIFLCDQDDIWYENKVSEHVKIYHDRGIDWVYNEVQLVDEKGEKIGLLTDQLPDYWTKRKLLYYTWGSCILGCATSYRADLLRSIFPADQFAPGHDSWIQLAIYPSKSLFIKKILQDYRQHENNVVGIKRNSDIDLDLQKKSIEENFIYLKSLSSNPRLSLIKRIFFKLVLLGKLLRSWVMGYNL